MATQFQATKLNPVSRISVESDVARSLLSYLREQGEDLDEHWSLTVIEGETSLYEAIGEVISAIDECEVLISGLKEKESMFASRRTTFEKRTETYRAAVEQAMLSVDASKFVLPAATVFLTKRRPGLRIDDESDIPSEFFVQPDPPAPKLNKSALLSALNEGRAVPGASLDNGTVSLSIRRK